MDRTDNISWFHCSINFVWIDKTQPSNQVVPAIVEALRSGDKVVRPEYSVVLVGAELVDPRLGIVLGIDSSRGGA